MKVLKSLVLMSVLSCSDSKDNDGNGDVSQDSGHGNGSDTEESSDTGDEAVIVDSPLVDSDCIDGQYSETPPDTVADISSPMDSYSSGQVVDFIESVLDIRYPIGSALTMAGYADPGGFSDDCISFFLNDTSSANAVIGQLSTIVHECGHFYDLNSGGWSDDVYHITEQLSFSCSQGTIPEYGGKTFARSLINNDPYASLHTPCANFTDSGCDSYAAIYLNGDPSDATFDSGDQGFNMLFEETVQYVNSLATGYAFESEFNYSVSERDGILTFLWYTMRYLRMARLEHPEAYALLSSDPCWREAILTVWGRAWFFLGLTDSISSLGINDEFLMGLVDDEQLLGEIQRLRDAQGCP